MRLIGVLTVLGMLVAASPSGAQEPQQKGLTGSWTFIWDGDPKNANSAEMKHEGGTITGTYINDAKEKCPLVGRMGSPNEVTLTITCPKWDIKAEGSTTNEQKTVVGKYVAYGSSRGEFKMSRK